VWRTHLFICLYFFFSVAGFIFLLSCRMTRAEILWVGESVRYRMIRSQERFRPHFPAAAGQCGNKYTTFNYKGIDYEF